MANAGPMIDLCFRHQYPGLFRKPGPGDLFTNYEPSLLPEFPRESGVTAELVPNGMNYEGYVWPELMVTEEVRE